MKSREILVSYALTYANGPLHLGHMTGLTQTDIWVRFQKMLRNQCTFICGCDSHGTPIMIQAEKMNISPVDLTEQMRKSHINDLKDFSIDVDNYHTTHSDENQELAEILFKRHQKSDTITKKTISQAYDPEKEMFLPDRLIKGTCPRCNTPDQYGDNCEACGATYTPTDLIDPESTLSGATPIKKDSLHYFFKLTKFENFLKEWTHAGHLQTAVTHKLNEWFETGLKEWDISRDAPYFGFKIPGESDKYFYCWLDAPVGYMASFKNLCSRQPELSFDKYWNKNSKTELYHFIGKDIIYFHALFWPAILAGAEFRTPTKIFTHGFLTIDGQKMSKSRGTFIKASEFLKHLQPDYFRYFIASRLGSGIDDIDLVLDNFTHKINSDIIGKFVNIASRCAKILDKNFNRKISKNLAEPDLFNKAAQTGEKIAKLYETLEFAEATREIIKLADAANQYIDNKKPWKLAKNADTSTEAHEVCSMGIQLFRQLVIYLKPVLPVTTAKAEKFLQCNELLWDDKSTPLHSEHQLAEFTSLAERVDINAVNSLKPNEK